MDNERIIASAINIGGLVIVGKRHCDCIKSAVEGGIGKTPIQSSGQGFYTNYFRFVDRKRGFEIAKNANQIIPKKYESKETILYSEDLR